MILELEEYRIPRELMQDIQEIIDDARTISGEDDDYNNDDVIAVDKRLHQCLKAQQEAYLEVREALGKLRQFDLIDGEQR